MATIGIRELRQRTAEVIRQVREEQAEYVITHQGRPVALLLPLDARMAEALILQASKQAAIGSWEVYARLAEELRQSWPAGKDTQALFDDLRQEDDVHD